MKSRALFAILPLLVFAPIPARAQQPAQPQALATGYVTLSAAAEQSPEKPFTLDFPGGRVEKFVAAVETATKEPFNVIIPDSAKDLVIPPVRVREVTLSRLLTALSASSAEQIAVPNRQTSSGPGGTRNAAASFEYYNTDFKFLPTVGSGGSMVWQLTVRKPPQLPLNPSELFPAPIARFYQLKPNLETGLKVEDITTVAQTAWKMMKLDAKDIPELKVHEETGILIAVGSENALQVLDSILHELPKSARPAARRPSPAQSAPATPLPAPASPQ